MFFPQKLAYWVVGPAGSGFVPPVDGSEAHCIIADLQEESAKCFGSSAVCGKVYIVNRKRHASTASDNYIIGKRFFRCSSWFLDGSFCLFLDGFFLLVRCGPESF